MRSSYKKILTSYLGYIPKKHLNTLKEKTQKLNPKLLANIRHAAIKLSLCNCLFIISWIHASTDPPYSQNFVANTTPILQFFNTHHLDSGRVRTHFGYSKLDPLLFPLHFAYDIWPLLDLTAYPSAHLLQRPLSTDLREYSFTPERPIVNQLFTASLSKSASSLPATSPCTASLTIRHIEPGGIGYDSGYTTFEGLFFPTRTSINIWPFIDLRAHRFDNNEFAANAGLGVRYHSPKKKTVFGINSYFDYRTDHSRRLYFTQCGGGLEMLGQFVDFRINAYIPSNKRGLVQKCIFDQYIGGYVMIFKKTEVALRGSDAEIGGSLLHMRYAELYAAAGGYYYQEICQNVVGGKLRVNARLFSTLTLDYMMTYDPVYNTKIQGQVGINFQFGCSGKKSRMQQTLTQPIRRNEIMVLDEYCTWKKNF